MQDILVSVGIPVYNAMSTLPDVLESILEQSFRNVEIIISDNCSTDDTPSYLVRMASVDSRIRLFHQNLNVGTVANFQFVLEQSHGEYFMWAAADDLRVPTFIQDNLALLLSDANLVGATSADRFDPVGGGQYGKFDWRTFDLLGDQEARIRKFLVNASESQGIFYGLIKREALKDFDWPHWGHGIGWDWAVLLHLVHRGPFARTPGEGLTLGSGGTSQRRDAIRKLASSRVEVLFPYAKVCLFGYREFGADGARYRWIFLRFFLELQYQYVKSAIKRSLVKEK